MIASTLNFIGRQLQAEEAGRPKMEDGRWKMGRSDLSVKRQGAPQCTPVLFRRCSWCGCGLGGVPAGDASLAGFFTDTICPRCFPAAIEDARRLAAAA